jgi:hypothetical protein
MQQQEENRLEHQVVWVNPTSWQNEMTIIDIHEHAGKLYGYCIMGDITWLVMQNNPTLPVWVICGWVRTA